MRHFIIRSSRFAAVLALLVGLATQVAEAQTVGDTFIDTSEWVQSSSPIRDHGAVQGYITETMVRGYRGPNYDRYYQSGNYDSAIEFSNDQKIRPIVYENSAGNQPTSLEPIRSTTQPVVQAANWDNGSTAYVNTPQAPTNRFASQAGYLQPLEPILSPQPSTPPRMLQSANGAAGSAGAPGYFASTPVANQSYPRGYAPMTNQYNTTVAGSPWQYNSYSPPANMYATTPVSPTPCQGCDPIYTQTQFVPPTTNPGPGTLQTYPQYGGNPYPRPGYSISQPYVRETWVPIIPLRTMPYGTYLGQGWIGQPVAYVQGEPVRNFIRYIFP